MARLLILSAASAVLVATAALGQTPQPFPRAGTQSPAPPAAPAAPAAPPAATTAAVDQAEPTEATLGIPLYPTLQFITSYDAGRSQRYFIFGTTAGYTDLVAYYRTILRERGNQVFDQPPTHIFEVSRFREETMAFPPSVTIKDWTWGGSAGYPNPRADGQPARFPTIVVIVPQPQTAAR